MRPDGTGQVGSAGATALISQGKLLLEGGDASGALALFSRISCGDPSCLEAALGAEQACIATADFDAALAWCSRASACDPQDPELGRRVAMYTRLCGRVDDATSLVELAIEQLPAYAGLWEELARCYEARGNEEAALDCYAAAAHMDPRLLSALIGAAWRARNLGRHEEALAWFRKAAIEDPQDRMTKVRIAQQLHFLGDWQQEEATLREIILESPTHSEALFALGELSRDRGDASGAILNFEDVVASDPHHERATVSLMTLLMRANRQLEAIARGNDFLEHAFDPDVFRLRVQAKLQVLDRDGCLKDLASLDQVQGEGAALAAEVRAEVAFKRFDVMGAVEYMSLACELEESSRRSHRLAEMQVAALKVNSARESLKRWASATRNNPWSNSDVGVRSTQGLIGDIINEYGLRPESVARARLALLGGDSEACAELVVNDPDSLAAATALLLILRRRGHLSVEPARTSGGGIPRVIIQAWFGGPIPDDVAAACNLWSETHPEWTHITFDDRSATAFLQDHEMLDALDAIRAVRHPAAKADLFRLAYLATSGGVWIDVDDGPHNCLDSLVDGRDLVLWQEERGNLGNNFVAAARGHPAIEIALAEGVRNCRNSYTESTWLATGPGVLTRAVARWIVESGLGRCLGAVTAIADEALMRSHALPVQPLAYKDSARSWQRTEAGLYANSSGKQAGLPTDRSVQPG